MPFTLAHPIAAAPIWLCSNKRLDLPGLLIGSMIPDLEYFIALQPTRTIGHTFLGIFIQGIPCAIVLLLIARYVLRRPFLALLPQQLAQRFPRARSYFPLPVSQLINIVLSIVIGAVSHLIWDAFTHRDGWFVTRSALLQSEPGGMPIYKLLQYGGGIFGVLALLIWFVIWLNQAKTYSPVETLNSRWRGLAIFCIVLCSLIVAWVAGVVNQVGGETSYAVIVRAVIGCISGLSLGLFLYSVAFWAQGGLSRISFASNRPPGS